MYGSLDNDVGSTLVLTSIQLRLVRVLQCHVREYDKDWIPYSFPWFYASWETTWFHFKHVNEESQSFRNSFGTNASQTAGAFAE